MHYSPIHFFGEPIEVFFDRHPVLQKKPGCPHSFLWRNETYRIAAVLSEWHDYRRRGQMARNMSPPHAAAAQRRGSWGVGQDYYRIRTDCLRYFDIYSDRAPQDADRRQGGWYIYRELALDDPSKP